MIVSHPFKRAEASTPKCPVVRKNSVTSSWEGGDAIFVVKAVQIGRATTEAGRSSRWRWRCKRCGSFDRGSGMPGPGAACGLPRL